MKTSSAASNGSACEPSSPVSPPAAPVATPPAGSAAPTAAVVIRSSKPSRFATSRVSPTAAGLTSVACTRASALARSTGRVELPLPQPTSRSLSGEARSCGNWWTR